MTTQVSNDYPRADFQPPVPPVKINQQPVDFSQAKQLADQIERLEQVYNEVVADQAALQTEARKLGLAPLDADVKPITIPFKPNSLLPFPEMLQQMEARKGALDSDIEKLAERNVKVITDLDNQINVQQYIAQLNESVVPSQSEESTNLNAVEVKDTVLKKLGKTSIMEVGEFVVDTVYISAILMTFIQKSAPALVSCLVIGWVARNAFLSNFQSLVDSISTHADHTVRPIESVYTR
jgi:hypothetical protein